LGGTFEKELTGQSERFLLASSNEEGNRLKRNRPSGPGERVGTTGSAGSGKRG